MTRVLEIPEKHCRPHGVHYTSRENVLRVIGDLFLNELQAALDGIGSDSQALETLHDRIGRLTFLDPACGSGDFLRVILEELQRLEQTILSRKAEYAADLQTRLSLARFYGFEIDPGAAEQSAHRLGAAHQDYREKLLRRFGNRLELKPADCARIIAGNALRADWGKMLPDEMDYIVGNPPYIARQKRSPQQNIDMKTVFPAGTRTGLLDYAAAWFVKSARYMQNRKTRAAFVVTNSITQGEQVHPLWSEMNRLGMHIHFARRTFRWQSEKAHQAGVSVVIIGFAASRPHRSCKLYHLENSAWRRHETGEINGYLVAGGSDVLLPARNMPLPPGAPVAQFGGMPNDGGHLLLDDREKELLVSQNPSAREFIRPLISVRNYLAGQPRWCLWLDREGWRDIPGIRARVEAVCRYRRASRRKTTTALAQTPHLFGEIRQPQGEFVLIPLTSSEHRQYIPMDLLPPGSVVNNTACFVDHARPFHFGVLISRMHMAWTSQVCGRLEGRYRYSIRIVYNNFPWPQPDAHQRKNVELAAMRLLAVRRSFLETGQTLASLYDPKRMPPELAESHRLVDKAVEQCYRQKPFDGDAGRLAFLFQRYREYACGETP